MSILNHDVTQCKTSLMKNLQNLKRKQNKREKYAKNTGIKLLQ